ncbi:Conserved_hypothetical protein [Hexamita inflata]|uniref:Transmembrane protein n=1 Tax=Hexamita inflata TaxID=28002 RepID=A0AA86NR77_9EUKA|nr:Conserved hypothetical protein [Hexamita inflata]
MNFILVYSYTNELIQLNNLIDCYYKSTKLTVNKNDRTILVDLVSTANSKCLVFPPDIAANLTISSAVFPDVLRLQVTDFDYSATDQLLFTIPPQNGLDYDLSLLTDEHFAVLQIYSLSEMTQVEINILDELKSDLTKCFSELSASFTQTGLEIHVCPSSACVQQIKSKIVSPQAYVKDVTIKVNEQFYSVDVIDFIDNYQLQNCFEQTISLSTETLETFLSYSFISSMFIINSQQGPVQVQLKYEIFVDLSILSYMFTRGEAFMYQRGEEKGYQILFDYDQAYHQQLLVDLQSLDYDYVSFRLTGKILQSQAYLIQGFSKFDPTLREISFSCKNGSQIDQERCEKMITDDMFAFYVAPSYNLDIIFYKHNQIVRIMKAANLAPRYTCWRYGVAMVSNNGLDLELTRSGSCDGDTEIYPESYINTTFWLEIQQNSIETFSTQRFEQLLNATNINKFNWNCQEIDCTLLYQDNLTILLKYDEGGFIEQIQVTKFNYPTFHIIKNTVWYMGLIIIICITLIGLILIVKVVKQIKSIRKQKHDHKVQHKQV